jgi:hypothetical protein
MPVKNGVGRTDTKICAALSEQTQRRWGFLDPVAMATRCNRMLLGWASYFCLGAVDSAYRVVDTHACFRLRQWLGRPAHVQGSSRSRISEPYCVAPTGWSSSWAVVVSARVRTHEPSCPRAVCGNPPVRFEEQGVETEQRGILGHRQTKGPATRKAAPKPPRHSSTLLRFAGSAARVLPLDNKTVASTRQWPRTASTGPSRAAAERPTGYRSRGRSPQHRESRTPSDCDRESGDDRLSEGGQVRLGGPVGFRAIRQRACARTAERRRMIPETDILDDFFLACVFTAAVDVARSRGCPTAKTCGNAPIGTTRRLWRRGTLGSRRHRGLHDLPHRPGTSPMPPQPSLNHSAVRLILPGTLAAERPHIAECRGGLG